MIPSLVSLLQRPAPFCPSSATIGQNPGHAVPPSQSQLVAGAITSSIGLKHLTVDLRHVAVDSLRQILRACIYSTSLQQLSIVGGVSSSHVRVMTPFLASSFFASLFNITIHPTSVELAHASALIEAALQSKSLRIFNLRIPTPPTPAWAAHAGVWKKKLQEVLQRNWECWNEQQNELRKQQQQDEAARVHHDNISIKKQDSGASAPAAAISKAVQQQHQQQNQNPVQSIAKVPTPPPARPTPLHPLHINCINRIPIAASAPAAFPALVAHPVPTINAARHNYHANQKPQQQQQQQLILAATYEAPKFVSPRSWSGCDQSTSAAMAAAAATSSNERHQANEEADGNQTKKASPTSAEEQDSKIKKNTKSATSSGNSTSSSATTARLSAFSSSAPSTCASPRQDTQDDNDNNECRSSFSPSPRIPEHVLHQLHESAKKNNKHNNNNNNHPRGEPDGAETQQGDAASVASALPAAPKIVAPATSRPRTSSSAEGKSLSDLHREATSFGSAPDDKLKNNNRNQTTNLLLVPSAAGGEKPRASPDPRPPRLPTPPVSHQQQMLLPEQQQRQHQRQQQRHPLPPLLLPRLVRSVYTSGVSASLLSTPVGQQCEDEMHHAPLPAAPTKANNTDVINDNNNNNKNKAQDAPASSSSSSSSFLPPIAPPFATTARQQQQQQNNQTDTTDSNISHGMAALAMSPLRTARVRSLGAKISQLDALLHQFDAETCAMKLQMRSVLTSARQDLKLLA